jgi:hypothetical protein
MIVVNPKSASFFCMRVHSTESDVFTQGHSASPFVRVISSRVIAHHFADIDEESSCLVANFVFNVSQQLRQSPLLTSGAYRKLIDSSAELSSLTSLKGCQLNPDLAFTEGILKPLMTLRGQGKVLQQVSGDFPLALANSVT